ncbi:mucin-12-like isoform X5 [Drosophila serrata]|uniref:mucin-12-like isoform X5 n=1 Tax=Drosophila serrata TaxID=7274 RepID=UPI000A1D1E00|nr:mucin-12-like isoform X5 [Drosophila serrata]
MYLIQTVQTTWRPQLPLPRELQLTDDRNNSTDDHDSKVITTTTTADIHNHNHHHQHHIHNPEEQEQDQDQEEDMDRLRGNHSIGGSSQQLSGKQKWSFGRLFRKKKEAESASSSEEDRKAGFVPAQRQSASKPKSKHGNKGSSRSSSSRFDHIVVNPQQQQQAPPHPPQPIDNEFFLPVETIQPEPYYQNQPGYYQRSSNSLDRRLLLQQPQGNGYHHHKSRSAQRGGATKPPGVANSSGAEEELISLNSSTFSKYRSDESIHLGSMAPGQSRRSRAARNERYYKRLSRDGEQSHGGAPNILPQQHHHHQQQRYKTQPLPLSIYQPTTNAPTSGYVQWQPQPQKNLQNSMQNDGKRSISYDSHIHLQNLSGRMQSKPLPPPPPPRDPLRRVHVSGSGSGLQIGSSSGDLRPVSYAFDQSGRCVSDDRIWQPPHYQSVHSLNSQPSSSIASAPVQQPHHRRFITRSERNAHPGKQSLPNGIDFHYVADATPRSRKPIHMMDTGRLDNERSGGGGGVPASSGILRTSKSGLATSSPAPQQQQQQQPLLTKPRSFSSSRLSELRSYPMPMYSEVQKPKRSAPPPVNTSPSDQDNNIICGSLHIKPSLESGQNQNYVEIRHHDVHKTNSMPHHYQNRRSGEDLPNKYEEYVAEKREQHQQAPAPVYPERKLSCTPALAPAPVPVYFPRKKPANLEEAINELEAIYKSLGLTEPAEPKAEPKLDMISKMRVPTPSDFEKFALAHADEYEDEDSPTGEPDPVRDDVAYRNLQLANLQHRSSEKQPPFGIPVGPIVPAPQSDYLHVEPVRVKKKTNSPDIVKDDLAVRALRKDPPGPKSSFVYPMQKKQRATRTQSANIYNLIQRDAAKPSGGDLNSYMELTRNLERSGSMSNLQGEADDVPATLDLLRKLKAQDEELDMARKHHPIPFRHPSQGGAIAQLPERLLTKEDHQSPRAAPVPAPRKSLSPEPTMMDDALNKIAQDAQASSIKLSHELNELRKEALITAARPKLNAEQQRLEEELQQIEAVSEAAKRCGQMLLDTLPDAGQEEDQEPQEKPPRKLHKEGKLIRAIDEVSEAANAVCEKILKDIVTTEPPVIVHEALQVKQTTKTLPSGEQLVMPHLIKKLDPIQSDKIEHIARRCMRQLSELANPDYDNLVDTCNMTNSNITNAPGDATLVCPVPENRAGGKSQTLEEIDKIMQECERQAKGSSSTGSGSISTPNTNTTTDDQRTTAPSLTSGSGSGSGCGSFPPNVSTTASSFSSSSDCLAKSSSPSRASRPLSSSITSFNPYSSSDYIKSQSSDCHAPSTDPIKTFSTTSYEGQSTPQSTTISTNTMSTTISSNTTNNPSSVQESSSHPTASPPPLQLTPVGERRKRGASCSSATSSPSQYNSSEELAAIFGIEEHPKHRSSNRLTTNATETIAASSDLSTAPATATAKTQEKKQLAKLLPNQDKQQTNSEDSSSQRSSVAVKYRGQHPHFHHHTTPAYYTDLQLRIHTPNVSDAGALNENYRSVYTTPSTQLVEQRSFPKTSTASSVAPVSFFRGDSASSEGRAGGNRSRRSQPRTGSEGRFFRYSQGSVSPTKGEVSHEGNEPITNHNSPITSSTVISSCNPVEQASPVVNASASGRNSRHKQRFHSRSRRAVRVRSESRPISALYDIICKEKNLDVGHTSSSSSSSNEEQEQERQKEKEQSKEDQSQQDSPKITTDKLATFWPLHHHYLNPQMSSSGNPKQPKQLQLPGARGAPSSSEDEEGALHALHSSHKVTNLSVKANSLPPPEDDSIALSSPLKENSSRLSLRLAKSLERAAPVSEDAPSYSPGEPICTERLFVEPPKMPKPATRHTLHDDDDGEEYDNTLQFNQCDVMDHWGQELRSSAGQELVNGVSANGHQSDPEAESPTQAHPSSLQPVEPKPHQSHHHHHQATNARRFITRTTRSASRQSSAGHSPPPFVAGHSDSSCSSPSPTRKRNNKQLQSGAATVDTQSSANGNSSAYETAATTVMTHGPATPPPSSQYHHQHHQHQQHLQLYPTASVPKTPSVESQSGAIVTSCPASSNAISDEAAASSSRRRRRRELGMARPLVPGDDEALRDLLHSPLKSSCSESTTTNTSKSESTYRPTYPAVRHPEVPVRTMTAVLPAPRPLHAPVAARNVTQKFNERTKTDLAEIKKIAEQSEQQQQQPTEEPTTSQKLSAILRRKSTDEGGVAGLPAQNSPPAPNQIVSILKKKEHGLGDCNSSASSNASPVTFSSSVMDPPLAGAAARCKRQGILKKRSSLDESRYYSRSHSPDERSILIKSARRNSLEEAGTGLSPAHQGHGILKQSSYDSSKSDGCPSANESQPHSILKKKDSLSTPSDGGCHKHVSISQAVTLAAAELAAHDGGSTLEDGTEEPEIRPILKQESTSSEEAVRPPKPILKKKSFGEADEPEMIRPILKSSRKSSREEFDLSGLDHDGNAVDSLSSILKSDSPSKRRSLGSTSHDLEESNNSLLKRRTRSLERQDAPPVMDLAAALDAISTSQAAPSTPVDFVTTPSSISVAERIKRMEMLSSPTARVAGGPNGSWESPLESATKGEQLGATPRLLKPSVLRRDLQRERYKTQPVTSEEKSFFKANSAPFDISATSAFKPTKPLDIRLSHALPHPPLISPITGQPLSHVPAPLLLSSSTHSGTGGATSFYRLTRSSTQPLQSPRVVHLASQGTTTNPLARQNSINDTSSGSVNLSEQLTLSLGTDSEQHIFEMSGLEEEDSAIQSLSDETAASATSAAATATATDTTTTAPSSGLTRSNSVRARANMFQQLQEQSRTPRATTGSSGTRHSPPAATTEVSPPRPSDHSLPSSEELSTPNTTLDAEFEPSSLSLAERLAFFSSLCGNNNSGTNSASGRYRSRTSSYSRSPPIDRTTPRSSTTASSSVSVTPTPMDYSPIPHEKEPSSLTLESIIEPVEQEQVDAKTKEPVLSESPLHNGFNALSRSATDPTNAATPIRTIRLRTVGKLVLPESFRNDRNNNTKTSSNNSSPNWNTLQPKLQTLNSIDVAVTVRSIGKIKSPFIEKQQEKMTNGTNSSDSGSDSGKENCASNHQQQEHQQQQDQDRETAQKVSEVRRKINRLVQQQQYQPPPAVNRRHTTEITSITMSVGRTPNVDDRYAKYFGVKRKDKDSEDDIENETYNSTTLLKTQSLPPTQSHSHHNQVEATNALVRLPITITVPSATAKRREMLKRSRPASMDHYTNGCISPTSAMPSPKRAHSPNNRLKATISNFEDIVVTPDELQAAGKDFKRLCGEILG